MYGIWLENKNLSIRTDLKIPIPQEDEALIKIRLAGICSTDLEMVRGYYPYTGILGHEFTGEIAMSHGHSDLEGKRVVGEINLVCGSCRECISNRSHHCKNRTVLGILGKDGVFAEYITLPLRNIHVIPDSITDEKAVFTEPLAAALNILEQVKIRPSDSVLVIGAGRLGQIIARVVSLLGCNLEVVTRHSTQVSLLKSEHIQCISSDKLQSNSWDIVIEATGSPSGFQLAKKAVRPMGTIVLKSTYEGKQEVDFSEIVVDEITLVGSRCGPFEPALQLLDSGMLNPEPLIVERFSLTDGLKAFKKAAQPGVLKVLIDPVN